MPRPVGRARPGRAADGRQRPPAQAASIVASRRSSSASSLPAGPSARRPRGRGTAARASPSASGSPTIVSRSASQRSLRPSRSERFARWQAVATRWPLSRSETGSRRDVTQSRKLRAWRRNWSYSSPESVLDRPRSSIGAEPGRRVAAGPPTGCGAAEPGDGVLRGDLGVGRDDEALARDRQAPARPAELQPARRGLRPGCASRCDQRRSSRGTRTGRPGCRASRRCPAGANRPPALVTAVGAVGAEEPVDDVERVLPEVRHLAAGVVPEPAEVVERPVRVVRPLRAPGRATGRSRAPGAGRRRAGEPKPGMMLR